jgi:hypothetical protein
MEDRIKKILAYKVIAVVGLSKNPSKPSHYVPRYMQAQGYRIIPVNPTAGEILGERCYPSLDEVQERIDVVNIFRPASEVLPIVEKAINKGVKAVWMQEGIVNKEAAELAEKNGILVVMDRCMMKEHRALSSFTHRSRTL